INQDVVAQNLANATTPGYRRQGLTFDALIPRTRNSNLTTSPGSSTETKPTLFTQFDAAPIQFTGNPLDVALSGDAFCVLEGPQGPVYTRNGVFELNQQGELQSKSGLRVLGQGSRIAVPADAGQITISHDGVVRANNLEIGRLRLATFTDPGSLQRVGDTLFAGGSPTTPGPGAVRVQQGYREGSNVQVINEMISMMLGMRQYEAAERAMRGLADAIGLNTKPQG